MKWSDIIKVFQSFIKYFIPLIAILIAWRSCYISQEARDTSRESNKIAEEALNNTKKSFVTSHRPYLSLEPLELKDGFLLTREKDKNLELEFGFVVKNTGKVPAKNIRIPEDVVALA